MPVACLTRPTTAQPTVSAYMLFDLLHEVVQCTCCIGGKYSSFHTAVLAVHTRYGTVQLCKHCSIHNIIPPTALSNGQDRCSCSEPVHTIQSVISTFMLFTFCYSILFYSIL